MGQCLGFTLEVPGSDGKERIKERGREKGREEGVTLKSTVSLLFILGQKKSSQLYERHIEKKPVNS